MILASEWGEYDYSINKHWQDSISHIWGTPKIDLRTEMETSYTNYSSMYGDDYSYSGHPSYEAVQFETKEFQSTFVLAYDTTCEFELKCLSGRSQSTDAAAEEVFASKDLALLKRLLDVIESKKGVGKLSSGPSSKLIDLLIGEIGSSLGKDRADLVVRVLENSITWFEPNRNFYCTVANAVDCVGWSSLSDAVLRLIQQGQRSFLELPQFLVRIGFLLKLRASSTVPESATKALIETCFNDFSYSCRRTENIDASVLSEILAITGRFGWTDLVERIVNITTNTMRTALHEEGHNRHSAMETMIYLAELLLELDSMGRASSASFDLGDVIKDFASRIQKKRTYGETLNFPFHRNSCGRIITALRLVTQHGSNDDCAGFGLWVTNAHQQQAEGFYYLLDKLSLEPDSGLSIEFLNRCLIGCNTMGGKWGALNPVIQIDQILQKFPQLPEVVDDAGRTPLHYATASECVCNVTVDLLFEAHPTGVSRIDPVTGLYPFMLAGANDNVNVAFKLLVADPSVVGSALGNEGKKRKRIPSMS